MKHKALLLVTGRPPVTELETSVHDSVALARRIDRAFISTLRAAIANAFNVLVPYEPEVAWLPALVVRGYREPEGRARVEESRPLAGITFFSAHATHEHDVVAAVFIGGGELVARVPADVRDRSPHLPCYALHSCATRTLERPGVQLMDEQTLHEILRDPSQFSPRTQ